MPVFCSKTCNEIKKTPENLEVSIIMYIFAPTNHARFPLEQRTQRDIFLNLYYYEIH